MKGAPILMSNPRPSTTPTQTLVEYLARFDAGLDPSVLREGLRLTLQSLMEAEVTTAIEAGHYERSGSRKTYRNGYRERAWASNLGQIELHIPKLRNGSYYPGFLRRSEGLLNRFVQRALVEGIGENDINALAQQLNIPPIGDTQRSDLIYGLALLARKLHDRPLTQPYPNVWFDLLHTESSQRVAVALGIDHDGHVTLLDFELMRDYDDDWQLFVARLIRRSLRGVLNVIGGDHDGLREAAVSRLPFASWRYGREEYLTRLIEQLKAEAEQELVVAISDVMLDDTDEETDHIWHIHNLHSVSFEVESMMLVAA